MDSDIRQVLEYASKQSSNMKDLGNPMHQSDALMNFDVFDTNSIGSLDDNPSITPSHNVIPIPITPLTKSQKQSAKKKACKEKQKLQL
ncbi:hypothetical protein RclHR1_02480022 [Rhizophagus clarus]|uniref:Uncharacterized protein n=1 Tax=Rhizophagus clarus TaxID=94130 RepID=A0A2Z6QY49_9GLOM|nr:hypothetical protein RclHR1_02480022 [Rhizophagus clarus]GET02836.1 hypothetical protein RCL_e10578_RclHR1_02480022 [Rhizophagus clarus]